jgi:uncharacterized protein (TIGR03083 family)
MSDSVHASQELMVSAFDELWGLFDLVGRSLSESDWALPTRLPTWTIQDVFAHLIGTEQMMAGVAVPSAPPMDSTASAAHIRNEIGSTNEAWVKSRRGLLPSELLEDFSRVTAARMATLRAMRMEALNEEAWTPIGVETFGRLLRIRVFDVWVHALDVTSALQEYHDEFWIGPDGVLNSLRIATALAVDEMAESLSFVVGKRVGARLGTSVAFRIEGTSARRLDVVVEGRARLVSHAVARPTATLTLDAGTLGALFSSRVAVHSVLESGRLSLDGDVALARAVAENLGFVL